MEIAEFTHLSHEAAWRAVFPPEMPYGARATHPKWQPWQEPQRRLLIDEFITKLAAVAPKRRDATRLKSRGELAAPPLRIKCPYYNVRHSIWNAIGRGNLWARTVDYHRADQPEREAKQKRATELAAAIRAFLEDGIDWGVCLPVPLYSDRRNPKDAADRAENCRSLERTLWTAQNLLQGHADLIGSDSDRISVHGNAVHNAWKASFAAELGYCWRNLTGRNPTLSATKGNQNFRGFVTAAFSSIGGDPKERWDRAIRQAIHDRPPQTEWDGFDRYEKATLPPGTRFASREETEQALRRLQGEAGHEEPEAAELLRSFLSRPRQSSG